mmetsp:Transcript_20597/g.44740  ORF Transcript_20597/g.44740 Transcript_20597/m.44740 type:complete len:384 (-) Transcript_20597:535-1686(-)
MCIENRWRQITKNIVRLLLLLAKTFEILIHLLSHAVILRVQRRSKINRLLEKHRVLTQKLQLNLLIVFSFLKFQMLHPKRAAANSIRLLIRILLPTHTKRQPINHPHRRGKLPCLMTLGPQILLIIRPNLINIPTKLGRLIILAPIALPLETALRRKLHVLVLIIDILRPLTQPLDGGIVTGFSPRVAGDAAFWYGCILGYVDHDLFGEDALFEFAHFGMFSSSAEGAGGFHIVIPHLLQMAIHQSIPKLEHGRILHILIHLSFRIRNRLLDQLLLVQMFPNELKVALVKFLNNVFFAEDGAKVGKEIFDKDWGCFGISEVHSFGIHAGEEGGGLLLHRIQIHLLPIIQQFHTMRLIHFRKAHPRMLHLNPLTSLWRILGIPP